MAGSWAHMVNEDGTPRTDPEDDGYATYGVPDTLENLGDCGEALEECYGMVWWLAAYRARLRFATTEPTREQVMDVIRSARESYEEGVRLGRGQ